MDSFTSLIQSREPTTTVLGNNVYEWTEQEVQLWVRTLENGDKFAGVLEEQHINGKALISLNYQRLISQPFNMTGGYALNLESHITTLNNSYYKRVAIDYVKYIPISVFNYVWSLTSSTSIKLYENYMKPTIQKYNPLNRNRLELPTTSPQALTYVVGESSTLSSPSPYNLNQPAVQASSAPVQLPPPTTYPIHPIQPIQPIQEQHQQQPPQQHNIDYLINNNNNNTNTNIDNTYEDLSYAQPPPLTNNELFGYPPTTHTQQ